MSSETPHDAEQCSRCGKFITPSGSERWTLPNGEAVMMPTFDEIYLIADTSAGEFCLCMDCYRREDYGTSDRDEIAEIHYELGLELFQRGDLEESADALHRALKLKKNANMLSALAGVYGSLGEHELELELYGQAIALDPRHHAASNLKLAHARNANPEE